MYAAAARVTQCTAVTLGAAEPRLRSAGDGAMRTTGAVIRAEPGNVRAYAARGHALCLKLDFDQGMKHIREGLRLDPDHAECAGLFRRMKRAGAALDRGRTASGKRDFQAACEAFTDALEAAKAPTHSPFTASVLAQRANARLRLREYDASLADCAAAIASQEDHKPAYFTQATALLHLGKPQEAEESLAVLLKMDPGDETVRRHHEKAAFEVRKSKRPDYYAILGISRVASVPRLSRRTRRAAWSGTRTGTPTPATRRGRPRSETLSSSARLSRSWRTR